MSCLEVSFAQTNPTNTGTLKLSGTSDTIYITGDFTNTSAASLTNNGRLYVKQNLSNDQASMTVGTGRLYLNGSSAQLSLEHRYSKHTILFPITVRVLL